MKSFISALFVSFVVSVFTTPTVFGDEYRTYSQVLNALNQLENTYPDIAKTVDIGTSIENRTIRAIKISDNPTVEDINEADILFIGGHHAREWISVEVPLQIAEYLCLNYSEPNIKKLIDNKEIWIVPLLNPDGYIHSMAQDRLWRKNRRSLPFGFYGVDLNRNYGFLWGGAGSGQFWWDQTYRGSEAFSEPCTETIKNLIEANENGQNVLGGAPNFISLISYHSYSQLILFPWGYTKDSAPDASLFKSIAENMAKLIKDVHGQEYITQQSSDMYVTSGDLTDWAYGEKGILAFTIELRPKSNNPGFELPADQINETFEENLPAALYLVGYTRSRVMDFEDGQDCQNLRSTIPGLYFTTTQGYDWIYGDWATGNYNGPYPNGSYFSNGDFFAWLGPNQGTGRIDFIGATANSLSVWTSTYSGLAMDAYDSNDNWLASSGWATNNLNTGTMTKLSVSADSMAYVLIHDSGNYWLIDDLEVEDIIAETQSNMAGKYSRVIETTESYNTGETKFFEFTNTTSQELNIVLNWAGSEFSLTVIKPDGLIYNERQSQNPPIKILVPDAEPGKWSIKATALDVDNDEPATLIVGSYDSNDIDNDGITNDIDNCRFTYNIDQIDTDGDGFGDVCDNCPLVQNPAQEDYYPFHGPEGPGNGIGDACEAIPDDIDEDGIDDEFDNCRTVPNSDQTDEDGDGIGNLCDNCPTRPNADQVDSNGDGIGDACDLIYVEIDIKPGSTDNCINNNGHGVIPVAILGSVDFDCTQIDPSNCTLSGLTLKVVGKANKILAHIEEVNNDGFDDLVLQFEDVDGVFQEGQTDATLIGNLYEEYGGTPIEGSDVICIVP